MPYRHPKKPLAAAALICLLLCVAGLSLSGCFGKKQPWHETDMRGVMPNLAFTMARAKDRKMVTAKDYLGKIVLVYFGYTSCADTCPATLNNIAQVIHKMGAAAKDVRVLFVTVDPRHDTFPVLEQYATLFAAPIDALRGTPDQLTKLTRRYRTSYSVTPATKDHPSEVTHSSAVYIFDKTGAIRLLSTSLGSQHPDIKGTAADLIRLAGE